jgi:tRNA-binding protein
MATIEDFRRIDLRTGTIIEVDDFRRAREPSHRVTIDFGPQLGHRRCAMQATNYTKDELVGMQIVAIVNLPARNIAGFMSEVLVLGVPGEDGRLSLLVPSRPAKPGGAVY